MSRFISDWWNSKLFSKSYDPSHSSQLAQRRPPDRNRSPLSTQLLQLDSSPVRRVSPTLPTDTKERNPRPQRRHLPAINSSKLLSGTHHRTLPSNLHFTASSAVMGGAREVTPRERALQMMHQKYCTTSFERRPQTTGLLVEICETCDQSHDLFPYCDNRESDSSDCDLDKISCDIACDGGDIAEPTGVQLIPPSPPIPKKKLPIPKPKMLPHFWR